MFLNPRVFEWLAPGVEVAQKVTTEYFAAPGESGLAKCSLDLLQSRSIVRLTRSRSTHGAVPRMIPSLSRFRRSILTPLNDGVDYDMGRKRTRGTSVSS